MMYKAIKDDKIIAITEDVETLEGMALDQINEDEEHSLDDYIIYNNEYVLKNESIETELAKESVRKVRNSYLEQYVDPKQLVLIWEDMAEEEQNQYKNYRRYLLDYTKEENWWKNNPKTFNEWSNE